MKKFNAVFFLRLTDWGLRKYAGNMVQVFGGDSGCEHEFCEWSEEAASFAWQVRAIRICVHEICQSIARLNIQIDTESTHVVVSVDLETFLSEQVSKLFEELFATSGETYSFAFVNAAVTIHEASQEIVYELIGNIGHLNGLALSRKYTKGTQFVYKIKTVDTPSINRPTRFCGFVSNERHGTDKVADEITKTEIQTDKTYWATIPNVAISDEQTHKISKVATPIIEVDPSDVISSTISSEPVSITDFVTEVLLGLFPVPFGTTEWLMALFTMDDYPPVSTSTRTMLASICLGRSNVERITTFLTNKSDGHSSIICLKCGAVKCELGLEPTPEMFVEHIVEVFREVRRVLRDDGTCWLNLGSSYASSQAGNTNWGDGVGSNKHYQDGGIELAKRHIPKGFKPKDLVPIPWMVAMALQKDGWYLRSDIIWAKPNPMPESVSGWRWERHRVKVGVTDKPLKQTTNKASYDNISGGDGNVSVWENCPGCATCEPNSGLVLRRGSWRPTKSHEYLFMLTKSDKYFADAEAVREPQTGTSHSKGTKLHPPIEDAGIGHVDWHKYTPNVVVPGGRNRRSVWAIPTQPYSGSVETSHLARASWDDASDGMIHIVSPCCPEHGDQFVQIAKEFYGGREADYWSRIERICNSLFLESFGDCAPTDQQRALGYEAGMKGYFPLSYSPTAIDHNNQIHRMALALDSSPPYIPFFEILYRTDDKRELLSSFVQHLCIYGNSILQGETDARLLAKIPHRIVDTSLYPSWYASENCSCLFCNHCTTKSDHFATFPEALVDVCIRASTSERGCCPKCGASWARVMEKVGQFQRRWSTNNAEGSPYNAQGSYQNEYKQSGWRPTCSCIIHCEHRDDSLHWEESCWSCDHEGEPYEPIPSIVLDPFCGSGTSLVVARRLKRSGIGLDLSMSYLVTQARRRLELDKMDAWGKSKKVGKSDLKKLPMFKEE